MIEREKNFKPFHLNLSINSQIHNPLKFCWNHQIYTQTDLLITLHKLMLFWQWEYVVCMSSMVYAHLKIGKVVCCSPNVLQSESPIYIWFICIQMKGQNLWRRISTIFPSLSNSSITLYCNRRITNLILLWPTRHYFIDMAQ